MVISQHEAQHGQGVCDRFTGTVFDVLIYCLKCNEPMEHHCCHKCCLACGIDEMGRSV